MGIVTSFRARGFSGTLQLAFRKTFNPQGIPGYILSRTIDLERYDREHDIETAQMIELNQLGFQSETKSEGTRYAGTSPLAFQEMIRRVPVDFAKYTFVDLGSGKGAALFYASDFPFRAILGVEFSPELHAAANRNISTFRSSTQKCHDLQALCVDAATFAFPQGPWIVFCNCPFGVPVWKRVAANLETASRSSQGNYLIHYQAGFRPDTQKFVAALPFLRPIYRDSGVEIFLIETLV